MSTLEATQAAAEPRKAPTSLTTNLGRVAGAVGVVLLVSTPLTWLLTSELGPLVWGKLLLGAALVGVYLATNADFFARFAGARSTGLMAMTVLSVLIVVGLLGVVNYLAYKNPKELDLTREGLYTLSEQTTGVLGRLKDEVKVLAFYTNVEPQFAHVEETLERYEKHSAKLSFEMVNPESRPDLIEKYNITDRGPRIVVTARGQDTRAKEASEEELTNAIIRVAEQTSKTVYFLTGHGELSIDEEKDSLGLKRMAEAVRAEGYEVKPFSFVRPEQAAAPGEKVQLQLGKADHDHAGHDHAGHDHAGHDHGAPAAGPGLEVPKDAAVLVVAGAQSKLFDPEVKAIEEYLNRGGRLIAMLEPDVESGLEGLLRQWKIEVRADLVVDTNPLTRLMGLGPTSPMTAPVSEHAVTKTMAAPVIVMTSRSLGVLEGGEAGVRAEPLLAAGETAWGETDFKSGTAGRDDKDTLAEVNVAVVASKPTNQVDSKLTPEGRIIAFGDSDWVNNKYQAMQGNADLFLNAVNWMAEEESKITIRPKTRAASQLFLTGEQMGQLVFLSMDLLPVLIIAMGLGIVLIRRQR